MSRLNVTKDYRYKRGQLVRIHSGNQTYGLILSHKAAHLDASDCVITYHVISVLVGDKIEIFGNPSELELIKDYDSPNEFTTKNA